MGMSTRPHTVFNAEESAEKELLNEFYENMRFILITFREKYGSGNGGTERRNETGIRNSAGELPGSVYRVNMRDLEVKVQFNPSMSHADQVRLSYSRNVANSPAESARAGASMLAFMTQCATNYGCDVDMPETLDGSGVNLEIRRDCAVDEMLPVQKLFTTVDDMIDIYAFDPRRQD